MLDDVKIKGSLGCSDCETVEFKILSGRKINSKINPLDFRRDFFKDLLGRIPQKTAVEGKGPQN